MKKDDTCMTRRTFAKSAAAATLLAAVGSSTALFGCSSTSSSTTEAEVDESTDTIVWSHCSVNCSGRCPLQFHLRDGEIAFVEGDNTGEAGFDKLQARACLKGRSLRRWINSPDRLMYPMKRTGERGEGKFEQITWDEAIQTVADKIKYTIDTYGNQALYNNYATAMQCVGARLVPRLFNLVGGFMDMYGDYSTAQITAAMPYTYGTKNSFTASPMIEALNSDLLILFGNNPAVTRMNGASTAHDLERVREAGVKIYNIDCRLNETSSGYPEEWIPIRPGTDAALVSALAYVLIEQDLVNHDFLDTYCVGYDEKTMPDGAPANSSYKDYIMGTGYDMIPKTPEWAAPITQIPADRIRSLAQEIGAAKALNVQQGWGPQRRSNGEIASRAIVMLPLLTGMVGLPGTSTGLREPYSASPVGNPAAGDNAIKAKISCFSWLDAVDHGETMTATKDGVKGVDQLSTGIKFIWNHAGNCLTNQHADINRVHDILKDESKCEFILVCDTLMTDSAKYADILIPDAMRAEQTSLANQGYSDWDKAVTFGQQVTAPKFESMNSYDFTAAVAEKLGVGDAFTEGKTYDEMIQGLYETARGKDETLPTWEEGVAMGFYKAELPSKVALKSFRDDPATNALSTPSGKIEIYSSDLATIASTWELDDGDVISPLPIYDPGRESYEDANNDYPLVATGFHFKGRIHSSYHDIDLLQQACRNQFWINPVDAEFRGIATDDLCTVETPRGTLEMEARVTNRIIPGCVALPQGSWHDADMGGDRVDHGGCINTITSSHPSPLAKGNAVHTLNVQVAKA